MTAATSSYADRFVPLDTFGKESIVFSPELMQVSRNLGPIAGERALEVIVKAMLEFTFANSATQKQWLALKSKLKLQLIKDTEEYGTTSVSMGYAQKLLDDNQYLRNNLLVLGNCGTGGLKVGFYKRHNGILRAVSEDLKQTGNVPSLNKVAETIQMEQDLNEQRLFTYDVATLQQHQSYLQEYSQQVKRRIQGLREQRLFGISESTEVYYAAFVTGPVRENWEKAIDQKDFNKANWLDAFVEEFFIKSPFQNVAYFISQQEEADWELLAAQTMHKNLAEHKQLGDDIGTRGRVIACGGVGMGSLQFGSFLIPHGMSCADTEQNVNELATRVKAALYKTPTPTPAPSENSTDATKTTIITTTTNPALSESEKTTIKNSTEANASTVLPTPIASLANYLLNAWTEIMECDGENGRNLIPIIALKSGMLLFLNLNPSLLKTILPLQPSPLHRSTKVGDENPILQCVKAYADNKESQEGEQAEEEVVRVILSASASHSDTPVPPPLLCNPGISEYYISTQGEQEEDDNTSDDDNLGSSDNKIDSDNDDTKNEDGEDAYSFISFGRDDTNYEILSTPETNEWIQLMRIGSNFVLNCAVYGFERNRLMRKFEAQTEKAQKSEKELQELSRLQKELERLKQQQFAPLSEPFFASFLSKVAPVLRGFSYRLENMAKKIEKLDDVKRGEYLQFFMKNERPACLIMNTLDSLFNNSTKGENFLSDYGISEEMLRTPNYPQNKRPNTPYPLPEVLPKPFSTAQDPASFSILP